MNSSAQQYRARLEELVKSRSTVIVAHRGTTLGSFPDNTARAALGAVRSGADMVEVDVVRSADGEYFLFHTGYEKKFFDELADVRTRTAAELDKLVFRWQGGSRTPGLERLSHLLQVLPDAWLNIDRSWGLWPDLLDYMEEQGAAHRVVLKSPPVPEAVAAIADHRVPFLYFPIVSTPAELAEIERVDGLNLVGAELLARQASDPFADPAAVAALARRYPWVMLNALNLENGVPLYLGFDDEVSVLQHPDEGWGQLIDRGATAIQTDWPHVLRDYLARRGLRSAVTV